MIRLNVPIRNISVPPPVPSQVDPTVQAVLDYLNVPKDAPSLAYLDRLITAYTQRVPWESASRIAKRSQTFTLAECPRFEAEFWWSAMTNGTGGTCFESNNAFFWLLKTLGFQGYLTLNNMNEHLGVHTAIVIRLDEGDYLVDAGFPLHLVLPLNPENPTYRTTSYHTYFAFPGRAFDGATHYRIERDNHPKSYCFTLIDRPINITDYRKALVNDYDLTCGLFLDRVIITRVIDDRIWRFGSDSTPYQLESFWNGDKTYHFLGYDPASASDKIAEKFDMNRDIIFTALTAVAEHIHT